MARLAYDDWLRAGLELLATTGADGLKIDRLCRRQGVTKGSFYHHFKNRDDFVRALLDYWQRAFTDDIIQEVDQFSEPLERSEALTRISTSLKQQEERAIRAWAQWDAQVASRVSEVDQQRLDYLAELIGPLIQAPEHAELVAKTVYAHFLGVQQLQANITEGDWLRMDRLLLSLFTAPEFKTLMEKAP